jgi:hypothetical protein
MFTIHNLDNFTLDALRRYCLDHDLSPAGHKGEVMDRIKRYMNKEAIFESMARRELHDIREVRNSYRRSSYYEEDSEARAMADILRREAKAEIRAEVRLREEERIRQEILQAEARERAEAEAEERLVRERAKAKAERLLARERLLAKAIEYLG